jgi:hypothetical protein
VTSWEAEIGNQSPPDPQIAASDTRVLVGVGDGVGFYDKAGQPVSASDTSANYLSTTTLFLAAFASYGLSKQSNGGINSYNDDRVIFDPLRKRFWIVAAGGCRFSAACASLTPTQIHSVTAVAVSRTEDPADGFYTYWWNAAVGWGTQSPPYLPGDASDYPSIGVDAQTVQVTVTVKNKPRNYAHVALFNVNQMEAGATGTTVNGWHFWDLKNPDGSAVTSVVQPAIAHGDPAGAFLVAREGSDRLTVWKVNDELQPTQIVTATSVLMPKPWGCPLPDPKKACPPDAPQKGGASKNTIAMSNLGIDPLKVVWNHWFLYVVTNDAKAWGGASDRRGSIRFVRLWTAGFPTIPAPGQGGSVMRVFGGGAAGDPSGGKTFYGWPAVEVDKDQNAIVVYARSGTKIYAESRYSAWMHGESDIRPSRLLKAGQGTTTQAYADKQHTKPTHTRWGDVAGASVDFVDGQEAAGVWIVHEYATKSGGFGLHVGKVLGRAYPNWDLDRAPLVGLPGIVHPGLRIRLSARLANGGDAAAPATYVRVTLSSGRGVSMLGRVRVPRLRPGQTVGVHFRGALPAALTPGRYTLALLVRRPQKTREYSTADDSLARTIEMPAPPPAATPSPSSPPAPGPPAPPPPPPPPPAPGPVSAPNLIVGAASPSSVTVVNRGDAAAGLFEVLVTGAGAFSLPGLLPGGEATLRFASPCSRTVRSFTVEVDARHEVAESDETDNTATVRCSA